MGNDLVSAEEARKLLAGATPGTWIDFADKEPYPGEVMCYSDADDGRLSHICRDPEMDDRPGDRKLIAAAPALARTVVALSEERDRLRLILACERGEWAPEGWERNDFDPEAIGLAWYRSTGTGDSETPNDGDTVMWVYREPPGALWTWEVERYDADGDNYCHIDRGEAPTALEAIEAADKAAGVERG